MTESPGIKRILIIDDASTTRLLLQRLLSKQGYLCTEAPKR